MSVSRAIGGYFGWEPTKNATTAWWSQAAAVQSGRMALRLALPTTPATLWLPAYFCAPVADGFEAAGWRLRRYALADDFGPDHTVQPEAGDRVLLVDYFGLCSSALDRAVTRFGKDVVIVDASMAWFSSPREGVPTAYSPRKFVGVPDGGILVTKAALADVLPADEAASQARTAHLVKREAGDVAGGRPDFALAEASLDADTHPRAMSMLTRQRLACIDWSRVARRRRSNAQRLSAGLRAMGRSETVLDEDVVPLCWPLFGVDAPAWRVALAACGIFCPAYWPGLTLPDHDVVGRRLLEATLCLPMDQRYGDEDMDYLLQSIDDLRSKA